MLKQKVWVCGKKTSFFSLFVQMKNTVTLIQYCAGNAVKKNLKWPTLIIRSYSFVSILPNTSESIEFLKCLCFLCCRSWGQSWWVNGTHEGGGRLETKEKNGRGRERHTYLFHSRSTVKWSATVVVYSEVQGSLQAQATSENCCLVVLGILATLLRHISRYRVYIETILKVY